MDGAVTPYVFACGQGLSEGFVARVECALGWVDDRIGAIEVSNSCKMVSSRKGNFVLNSGFWTEDVKTSQDNRASKIHTPMCKGTNVRPSSPI